MPVDVRRYQEILLGGSSLDGIRFRGWHCNRDANNNTYTPLSSIDCSLWVQCTHQPSNAAH